MSTETQTPTPPAPLQAHFDPRLLRAISTALGTRYWGDLRVEVHPTHHYLRFNVRVTGEGRACVSWADVQGLIE